VANTAGSKKRVRQAEKRRSHNVSLRSTARTYVKKVVVAIDAGDKEAAQIAYTNAVSKLDKSVSKGIYTKNKAARHKSNLSAKIKAL
jgi:small subunit ribosomal protein S20